MKLITITFLVALCLVGVYQLGARSSRPDLTLTTAEELSMQRSEAALHASLHAVAENKDPAKVKALTDDRDAKHKADIAIADKIRKAHRCESCDIRWYLETDGSMALLLPTPAVPPQVPEQSKEKK